MQGDRFQLKRKLGEGSFAVVVQAFDAQRNCDVAIKCLKDRFGSLGEALRDPEVQIFRCLPKHPNIVNLLEVLFLPESGRLSLVFEYMEASLWDFMMQSPKYAGLTDRDFRFVFYQIANGVAHLHAQGVFHRDLKPENILIDGATLQVKLADFGCCKGIYHGSDLTEYISTRWYRPPECVILSGYYGKSMDIWAAACVFFEVLTSEPMFPGKSEVDQVSVINSVLGSPGRELLEFYFEYDFNPQVDFTEQPGFGLARYLMMFRPGFGRFERELVGLLGDMLHQDSKLRISAEDVLRSPFFAGLDVAEQYARFCSRDGEARANELFHRLMRRHRATRAQTLDVLRHSLLALRDSRELRESFSGGAREALEEQVVRKMAKTKTLDQRQRIRRRFRELGDDILELGKLDAHSGALGELLRAQAGAARTPPAPGKKRGLRAKRPPRRRRPAPRRAGLGATQDFRTHKKPKHSHFPSVASSGLATAAKASSEPQSLANILSISKFDLSSQADAGRRAAKKSTFGSIKHAGAEGGFELLGHSAQSDTAVTQFDDGHANMRGKSIFGGQLGIDLDQVTSINRPPAHGQKGFFESGYSSGRIEESETFQPDSTFGHIELASNAAPQVEPCVGAPRAELAKLFSFSHSGESLASPPAPKPGEQALELAAESTPGNSQTAIGDPRAVQKRAALASPPTPARAGQRDPLGAEQRPGEPQPKALGKAQQARSPIGSQTSATGAKHGLPRLAPKLPRTPLAALKNGSARGSRRRAQRVRKSRQIKADQNQRLSQILLHAVAPARN